MVAVMHKGSMVDIKLLSLMDTASTDRNYQANIQGLEDGAHQVDMRFEGSDFGGCTASVRIGVGPAPGVAIVSPSGETSIA